MNKPFIQILILLVMLLSANSFAQENNAVDIRAKVKAQMLQAQGNMPMVTKESINKSVSFPSISSGVFKVLILFLVSIVVLSLVFLRRVKIQEKVVSKQFRENIRLIREESLKQPINYSLTPVRKSLLEKIESCFEEKTITALARKLNIAKGEIMLVNSIKNYVSDSNVARN
ncbi:MAG: hypothetical protein PF445_01630 [Melioribacteraceae bacterium]|jgi:hypothetical protein|nr:hypothetical protein [Melioribacteraceae bacterium]